MNSNKKLRGFAFVGTPIEVDCLLPFEFSKNLSLRLANRDQKRKIKSYLRDMGGHADATWAFEYDITSELCDDFEQSEIPVYEVKRKRIPASKWRYYVVQFKDCNPDYFGKGCHEITDLRAASKLTKNAWRLNPVFALSVLWSRFTSDWEFFTSVAPDGDQRVACDKTQLEELKSSYVKLQDLSSSHPKIARSVRMYHDLPDRLGQNELTSLALFSVLESLITHSPRGAHDSIGHQIRKKVALVDNRLPDGIDYRCFDQGKPDTIWSKLYEFRSRIAHGGKYEIDSSLSLLKDSYTVEKFLKEAIKELLNGAMEEPDLYSDLQAV